MRFVHRGAKLFVVCLLLAATTAFAEETYTLDIERQSLSSALKQFAEQSGLQIVYYTKVATGRMATRVAGNLSANEALEQLLAGTDLTFEAIDERTIAISAPASAIRAPASTYSLPMSPESGYPSDEGRGSWNRLRLAEVENQNEPETQPPESDGRAYGGDEVVVTRSRLREEVAQEVPVAVSVVSADQIEALHSTDIRGLSYIVPNFQISTVPAGSGVALISMRGFSASSTDISVEPGIALYVDGVYQSLLAGSLADFNDLERVEVLRGPQGSLLGKNASAGALLLTRSRPTGKLEGSASVEYGTYNTLQAKGVTNFPITDVLSAKVFASYRKRDDFQDNIIFPNGDAGGEDRQTVRGALMFEPSDDFDLYVTADYTHDNPSQQGMRQISLPGNVLCQNFQLCNLTPNSRRVTRINFFDRPIEADDYNVAANANWRLGGMTVTSITGYRNYDLLNQSDVDGSELTLLEAFDVRTQLEQYSQELRLSSTEGGGWDMDGKLAWLIAAYYGVSDSSLLQPQISGGAVRNQLQHSDRMTQAVFSHVDYDVTDWLGLSVGARYSQDEVDHRYTLSTLGLVPGPFQPEQSAEFSDTSIEAGAQAKLDANKMIYFRYAEGYRGGGFVGFPTSNAAASLYRPETSTSYELGAKTDWLDGALRVNVTLFNITYDDLQRSTTALGPGNTFVQVTDNIAKARTRGIELETITTLTDAFEIRANVGYLDAKYLNYVVLGAGGTQVDRSNDPFPYAPEWTGSITPSYDVRFGGDGIFDALSFSAKVDYRSEQNVSNIVAFYGRQGGYATTDLNVRLGKKASNTPYSLFAYVQNVFDKDYITYASSPGNIGTHVYDNPGRLVGVGLNVEF